MPISDFAGTLPGRSGDVTGSDLGHDGDVPGTYPAQPITYYPSPITSHTLLDSKPDGLVCVSDENNKLAKAGLDYLLSLNHPNFSSPQWVAGYLGLQFQELEQTRPDIPKPEILAIWQDTCDIATQQNKPAAQWSKSTFKNKLDAWTPSQAKTHAPDPASGERGAKAKALLEFPFIRHIVTNEIFNSESLEVRSDALNGLTDSVTSAYYPIGHLEGLTEVPAND